MESGWGRRNRGNDHGFEKIEADQRSVAALMDWESKSSGS